MSELNKIFYVNAGKGGTFAESGKTQTTPADADGIITYMTEKDIEKLVIYFHGGLVGEKSGLKAAEVMRGAFDSVADKRHVVTFVWETGPIETIVQNIHDIKDLAGKDFFKEVLKFVIKIVGKRMGLDDAAKGGGTYLSDATISEQKMQVAPFEELDKVMDAKGGADTSLAELEEDEKMYEAKLENEARALIQAEGSDELKNAPDAATDEAKGGLLTVAKVVGQIAFAVLKRYLNKTHHNFYPTVMEEALKKVYADHIGTWTWKQMKDKAADMFKNNTGLSGNAQHVGTYFFNQLNSHAQQRLAAGKKFEIELIGHSAGSIVICHLLDATGKAHPQLKYNHVFFLAPACRVDLFLDKGAPAIETGQVSNFKLFTMKEENEKKDHCVPFVYTHSLLYMISGLFEMPEVDAKILGLHEQFKAQDRYADFDELVKVNTFINNHKLVLSEDILHADTAMRSNSFKHGDFDNDPYTLAAILKTIS